MSLFALIFALLVLGVIAYLVQRFAPIPANFKTIINVVLLVVAVLLVGSSFGLCGAVHDMAVPQLHTR